jgi:FkbM family methyltransferase
MSKRSFSQCGEDLIITSLLRQIDKLDAGFYMDIGAFDPIIGSNTYYFYRQGWSGINIDARPGSMNRFKKDRPRDINLEMGIGSLSGKMKYHMIESRPEMNTFSLENLIEEQMQHQITSTFEVPMVRLGEIQKKYVPANTHIDFVSIDTEGHEMEVISGFDFEMHRPTVFAVELSGVASLDDVAQNSVNMFLASKGYLPVGKNIISFKAATVFYFATEHLKH